MIILYLWVVFSLWMVMRLIHRRYNWNYQLKWVLSHAIVDTIFIYIFNRFDIYTLVMYFNKNYIDYHYFIPKLNGIIPILVLLPLYIYIKWLISKKKLWIMPISKYVIDELVILAISNYGTMILLYFVMTVIFWYQY